MLPEAREAGRASSQMGRASWHNVRDIPHVAFVGCELTKRSREGTVTFCAVFLQTWQSYSQVIFGCLPDTMRCLSRGRSVRE